MAIQQINLGSMPLGAGGDSQRAANAKINENFSNSAHAASRLVGTANGQIPLANQAWEAASGKLTWTSAQGRDLQVNDLEAGTKYYAYHTEFDSGPHSPFLVENATRWFVSTYEVSDNFVLQEAISSSGTIMYRSKLWGVWTNGGEWVKSHNTGNTKKDSNSNLILASEDTIPQTSAASRLVGTSDGRLAEVKAVGGVGGTGWGADIATHITTPGTVDDPNNGYRSGVYVTSTSPQSDSRLRYKALMQLSYTQNYRIQLFFDPTKNDIYMRVNNSESSYGKVDMVYHTGNTQSDTSTNGYIKPSSPIVMLHSDKITTNDDGEKMGVEFTKKGIGDYEIAGTTGLRDVGWYIEIPNDLHGNPMVAVTLEEKDGTLILKSFKRVFNMQTFKFEPDLDSPMDIPEGRWIDLRFNDLPQEELNEPIE